MKKMELKQWHAGLLALAIATSCSQGGDKNTISGVIKGAEGRSIYLERQENDRYVRSDSATIASDGSFSLRVSRPMEPNYYKLAVDREHFAILITDSTESPRLEAELDNMKLGSKVSGSAHTQSLYDFYGGMGTYITQLTDLQKKAMDQTISQEARDQLKSQFYDVQKQKVAHCKKWLETHSDSPAALAALSEMDVRTDLDQFKKVMSALSSQYGHSSFYREMSRQVDNQEMLARQSQEVVTPETPAERPAQMSQEELQKKLIEMQKQQMAQQTQQAQQAQRGSISVGVKAPEIAQKSPDGKILKLSSLKGKVVLIDFWASWCGPCRRENPNVVAAYNKYKSKGFEVFSVSLDNTPEKWKAAIAQDGLVWPYHVSDLAGWGSVVARDYGVSSIPFPVLIDKEGKVVNYGQNIRGPMLEMELAKLLGG